MNSDPNFFTPWALLAASSTGSTWVNHVLSSHPCVASVGEILLSNRSAASHFHASPPSTEKISAVLAHVTASNLATLRSRTTSGSCSRLAGGVKLKLAERDVTFGENGNARAVAAALQREGFRVILLRRSNHLDSVIGRLSRQRTGQLHCRRDRGGHHGSGDGSHTGCNPAALNLSLHMHCSRTRSAVDRLRLRHRASESVTRSTGISVLRLEYEQLVGGPRVSNPLWEAAMRHLDLEPSDACLLRDASYQKRVVQTQREIVTNFDMLAACFEHAGPAYARLLRPDVRPASGQLPWQDAEGTGVSSGAGCSTASTTSSPRRAVLR